MSIPEDSKFNTGLIISKYRSKDIVSLLPLLAIEFPDWSLKKIKSYIDIVIDSKNDVSGILVAKNEAEYYVGLLIYTFQQIKDFTIRNSTNGKKDQIVNIFVVENLIASSLILQNKVFLSLVDEGIKIGKDNSCDYIELPKFDDESYDLIKEKYRNQIVDSGSFRTYLDIKF